MPSTQINAPQIVCKVSCELKTCQGPFTLAAFDAVNAADGCVAVERNGKIPISASMQSNAEYADCCGNCGSSGSGCVAQLVERSLPYQRSAV